MHIIGSYICKVIMLIDLIFWKINRNGLQSSIEVNMAIFPKARHHMQNSKSLLVDRIPTYLFTEKPPSSGACSGLGWRSANPPYFSTSPNVPALASTKIQGVHLLLCFLESFKICYRQWARQCMYAEFINL